MISRADGKLVVIDNADILLDDDTRKYISLDDTNQYLIIWKKSEESFCNEGKSIWIGKEKGGRTDGIYD